MLTGLKCDRIAAVVNSDLLFGIEIEVFTFVISVPTPDGVRTGSIVPNLANPLTEWLLPTRNITPPLPD
jgi:hypothetical protein